MGWEYTKKVKATKDRQRGREREKRKKETGGMCSCTLFVWRCSLFEYLFSVVRKAGKQADQKESTEVFLLQERRKKRGCLSMSNVYRFFVSSFCSYSMRKYVHFISTKSTTLVGIKLRWRKDRAGGFSSLFFLFLFLSYTSCTTHITYLHFYITLPICLHTNDTPVSIHTKSFL